MPWRGRGTYRTIASPSGATSTSCRRRRRTRPYVEDHDLHKLGLPCRRSCDGDGQCKRCAAVRRTKWWFGLFGCWKFRHLLSTN
jgi:hypothetical protein